MTSEVRVRRPKEEKTAEEKGVEGLPSSEPVKCDDILYKEIPEFDSHFKRIAEYINEAKLDEDWELVRAWIAKVPGSLNDVMQLMSEHAAMSMRAKRIYLLGKRELSRYEDEHKDKMCILHELAIDYWESKKREGMHKQVTESMIDDWILDHYPDTYKEMRKRLVDLKNTVELLKEMSDQVASKGPDLRRLLDVHSRRERTPDWFGGQQREREKRNG